MKVTTVWTGRPSASAGTVNSPVVLIPPLLPEFSYLQGTIQLVAGGEAAESLQEQLSELGINVTTKPL
jgi:hypothetical protein